MVKAIQWFAGIQCPASLRGGRIILDYLKKGLNSRSVLGVLDVQAFSDTIALRRWEGTLTGGMVTNALQSNSAEALAVSKNRTQSCSLESLAIRYARIALRRFWSFDPRLSS